MLVMMKTRTNLFESFDYQNAGPKMNFLRVSTHALDRCFVLFVCFVALRPKSTSMVIAGRSVHLATVFTGQA